MDTAYKSYEEWCKEDVAQAALKSIYEVMAAAAPMYPTEPWREHRPDHHIRKAVVHACAAHHWGPHKLEDGKGARTGKLEIDHALTRLAMARALMADKPPIVGMVIDTSIDEAKQE